MSFFFHKSKEDSREILLHVIFISSFQDWIQHKLPLVKQTYSMNFPWSKTILFLLTDAEIHNFEHEHE